MKSIFLVKKEESGPGFRVDGSMGQIRVHRRELLVG